MPKAPELQIPIPQSTITATADYPVCFSATARLLEVSSYKFALMLALCGQAFEPSNQCGAISAAASAARPRVARASTRWAKFLCSRTARSA